MIEAASASDARAIGIVHVLSWHETYRGIVPDDILASLNPAARADRWHRVITTDSPEGDDKTAASQCPGPYPLHEPLGAIPEVSAVGQYPVSVG